MLVEISTHGADLNAYAIGPDFLRAEEGPLAVATKDVVQCDGHLQCLMAVVQVAAGVRIAIIIVDFHLHFAGLGIDAVEP